MPQTIFLEFKHEPGNLAANGTDVTFYIDGRWSWSTTEQKIHERVDELRTKNPRCTAYAKQLFVGFTYAGGREGAIRGMVDHNPPQWFLDLGDADPRFAEEIRRNRHVRTAAWLANTKS